MQKITLLGCTLGLLLASQVDEFYSVSRYTDCEVSVFWFLWVFHSVNQFVCTKYVNVQVMCSLIEVSVHYTCKIFFTLVICVSKCTWADCLSIRNTIQSQLVWQLSNRVKRCKKSALFCTVRWVSTW